MRRTTPELAPTSPTFPATPTRGRLATTFYLECPIHGGSSVQSCFEPTILRFRGRDLATRPPRPVKFMAISFLFSLRFKEVFPATNHFAMPLNANILFPCK
ncbi:hypothetical protein AVEN_124679-1 [Araneus ventricosus]|uniref:Uncharacterized protein n=1 Tax=Araneus ventricosus TaxID=182803 RepID=A0A4Y2LGI2_ARAVE|nr:hypothetical protein AVEN_124679-1 [Araneus ventricosus]